MRDYRVDHCLKVIVDFGHVVLDVCRDVNDLDLLKLDPISDVTLSFDLDELEAAEAFIALLGLLLIIVVALIDFVDC